MIFTDINIAATETTEEKQIFNKYKKKPPFIRSVPADTAYYYTGEKNPSVVGTVRKKRINSILAYSVQKPPKNRAYFTIKCAKNRK